ncbi:MAG: ABC transporter substrate-binding protein [Rhodobacteraceae bacterium]|nr:ABC transporter substrate-binding protein [Paracoccaceae bacterium]
MSHIFCKRIALFYKAVLLTAVWPLSGHAAPQHGIAMAGNPALPAGFTSLPYANPGAPKGGTLVTGERGGFDSLNPYILKGTAPWGVRAHTMESLMGRNWDEPFALYGLLAETIEVPDDRSWVAFTLRPEARFSNGDPVTVKDVIWSLETLGTLGHPRYRTTWSRVEQVVATGPRSLRITFSTPDRELPLILGLHPILRKADFANQPFGESGLAVLTGSGAYVIEEFEPDRFITFRRTPHYWGADLGLKAGHNNLDRIRYDYYRDAGAMFEAFKAGALDFWREGDIRRWDTGYTFPRVTDGTVVRSVIPHGRPSGMSGFVFNTRRPIFADWRVREALMLAFNPEFINRAINGGRLPRIESFFANSVLGARPGPAEGRVAGLLAPFAAHLLPGTLEGYRAAGSDGSARNRKNLRRAGRLLEESGWILKGGVRRKDGAILEFTVLLQQDARKYEAIANMWRDALDRLGVRLTIAQADAVQYRERLNTYDFDMIHRHWGASLSPGNEQRLYWGSAGVTQPGTRNYMGARVPAIDAMIEALLAAENREDFVAATRALDRVLTAGRYVVPFWFQAESHLAHDAGLRYPDRLPVHGDWVGFMPDVWWRAPAD